MQGRGRRSLPHVRLHLRGNPVGVPQRVGVLSGRQDTRGSRYRAAGVGAPHHHRLPRRPAASPWCARRDGSHPKDRIGTPGGSRGIARGRRRHWPWRWLRDHVHTGRAAAAAAVAAAVAAATGGRSATHEQLGRPRHVLLLDVSGEWRGLECRWARGVFTRRRRPRVAIGTTRRASRQRQTFVVVVVAVWRAKRRFIPGEGSSRGKDRRGGKQRVSWRRRRRRNCVASK
mmetsp:Transcript_3016/g.7362  ORF Transcript_3016/g.7362 Transcript_3016/m.7362 type:complete len:229 (+) Transcript_3016:795-1481(+)